MSFSALHYSDCCFGVLEVGDVDVRVVYCVVLCCLVLVKSKGGIMRNYCIRFKLRLRENYVCV